MTYQSLYRKYRPKHLDEVVGQEHILNVLNNSLKKDMISHAYLFCGPRGTGKTSIAKLLAQSINCDKQGEIACKQCDNCIEGMNGTHPDIVEIDAASNNGVEEIRSLIDKVKYTPILGKYKVYIIDEVHMLSQGAFNAFLKTLEEPPEHAVFILATTEIHKVLPTIISRCQRFDFTNIKEDAIAKRLDYILEEEGVKAEAGVTHLIASLSSGALRNALTILEQAVIIADEEIKLQEIYDTNGVVTSQQKIELFESFNNESMNDLNTNIEKLSENVINVERLMMELVRGLKDSVIYSYTKNEELIPYFDIDFIKYLDTSMNTEERLQIIDILLEYVDKMKFSQNQETYMELSLLAIFNRNNVPRETTADQKPQSIADFVLETFDTPKPQVVDKPVVEKAEPVVQKVDAVVQKEEPIVQKEVVTEVPDIKEQANIEFDVVEERETIAEANIEPTNNVPRETITETLTQEEIVRFMVSADKEQRLVDLKSFEKVSQYRTDLNWARPSRLMDGSSLVLSGNRFIVLAFKSEMESRELMEPRNKDEIISFSDIIYGSRKQVFATTNKDFKQAVEKFLEDTKNGTLPEPYSDNDFIEEAKTIEKEAKDESLEKVKDLFGEALTIV